MVIMVMVLQRRRSDFKEIKPLHDSDGRLQGTNRENTKPYGNGNGHISARIEKRKKRHLGRMGNVKKVQSHESHVPEESKEEMDIEKHKPCNEDLN